MLHNNYIETPLLFLLWHQQAYSKNQPVYGNETWHTYRVLKPYVERHTGIIPISFAAPSGGAKSNRGFYKLLSINE